MNFLRVSVVMLVVVAVVACDWSNSQSKNKKKVNVVFSLDGPPASYLNENGELVGSSVSMVKEICTRAKMDCNITYTEDRTRCWNGATNKSEILDNGEALVCANLVESPARSAGYLFAEQSIFRLPLSILIRSITATDEDISVDKLTECNHYKMAFPENTALTRDCLLNAGLYVREENAMGVPITSSIVAGQKNIATKVVNGEMDFAVVIPTFLFGDDVKTFGSIQCSNVLIGLNIMVSKNNEEAQKFLELWDATLINFICDSSSSHSSKSKRNFHKKCSYFSNDYEAFCAKLHRQFDTDPRCFTPGIDVSCPGKPLPSTTPTPPPVPVC